jgi:hypothetical protein
VPPSKPRRGRPLRVSAPEWEPLLNLAPDHVGDFMWMGAVELTDGVRLDAYKHRETQRYLHLDHKARAFVFIWDKRYKRTGDPQYEEVDARWLLDFVSARSDERATLLRQYVAAEFNRLKWARSATKHRISRRRTRHALENCVSAFRKEPEPGPPWACDMRLVIFGEDGNGVPLEVIAVRAKDSSMLVIHSMKLRSRYRVLYEEVRRWEK